MTHSKRCWKHLLKDLGLKKSIELLQIFWPLVSDMNFPFPHVSKVVLVWDVTVEAISVQRASCHLQENSLRWFQLHDTVRYVGASNHHKMGTLWTWWDELRCLTMFLSTKGSKVCQGNAPQTITSPLPTCTVGTRQNGFVISCCLCQIWTYHMNIVAYIKTH